ncbi:four helix bundle protein [Amniculibacterium aquaticum]|uniref:four helix bundle protein n=1 Tax=Amniculibacterium aquaticum TaxID=2479858 RepID=UPI001F156FE8|nr:four helix bundle protein [Amniculibacterium aquaticum]
MERSKRFRNNNFQSIGRFPKIEQYGITNQIRRVTFSISANIAEGISRKTNADKARFINQAYSSSIEVLNFLIISHELTWIETEKYIELRKKIESITNKLNSFYNKLKNNDNLTT